MNSLGRGMERVLLVLAVLGFLVPNGLFLGVAFLRWDLVLVALGNPIALVFIGEAFLLMFLLAWFLPRLGPGAPSPVVFILLSLAGSLAFSVPLSLLLLSRRAGANRVV